MAIELGDTARDTITGFEGVVVARTEWLNNCIRLSIQPTKLQENGQPIEACTFDEPHVELVRKAKEPVAPVKTGGPRPAPRRTGF